MAATHYSSYKVGLESVLKYWFEVPSPDNLSAKQDASAMNFVNSHLCSVQQAMHCTQWWDEVIKMAELNLNATTDQYKGEADAITMNWIFPLQILHHVQAL